MLSPVSLRAYLLSIASMSSACATSPPATSPVALPPTSGAHQPEVEHTFVSTSNNADDASPTKAASAPATAEYVVTTPDAAKQLALAAVADRLDPLKTWTTSPLLPASWPVKDRAVVYFFYPMAANPRSMTEFQLFSAAWRVEVSLRDGEAAVTPIPKSRDLGKISQTRASSLERRELEIAEAALVHELVGTEADADDSPYWGYLKYMHEHPQLAKDLQRRSPSFLGWVRKRYGK
jgi:hypothetical protein